MDELCAFAERIRKEKDGESYNIDIEGLVENGENFMGEVLFFNITLKDNDESLHFVRKKAKYMEVAVERKSVRKAYLRESYMYKVIFPEFRTFLAKQKSDWKYVVTPRVHYIKEEENQEILIFENMKYCGFQMLNKKLPMDHEKISAVIKSYAEFHATSFAMKELEPENFENLTRDMDDVWITFKYVLDADNYFKVHFRDALNLLEEKGRSDLELKYKPIEDDMENIVYVKIEESDRLIISHGDCWMNNMLFKIDENGSTQSVCLIDFQMSCLGSPVMDLCLLLLSAGDEEILYNIEKYLKLYHESLSNSLRHYGIDSVKVFPFEKLMEHWKKYAKTGLVQAIAIIQISLAEVEDIPEGLDAFAYTDPSEMRNKDIFCRRISDLLISFGDKFL